MANTYAIIHTELCFPIPMICEEFSSVQVLDVLALVLFVTAMIFINDV